MTVAESNNAYAAGARFKGQTAIVTGAGSGIGRATAVRLVREGRPSSQPMSLRIA
jgi:anaerobic glycerol-3-phosphate dehydrogenase